MTATNITSQPTHTRVAHRAKRAKYMLRVRWTRDTLATLGVSSAVDMARALLHCVQNACEYGMNGARCTIDRTRMEHFAMRGKPYMECSFATTEPQQSIMTMLVDATKTYLATFHERVEQQLTLPVGASGSSSDAPSTRTRARRIRATLPKRPSFELVLYLNTTTGSYSELMSECAEYEAPHERRVIPPPTTSESVLEAIFRDVQVRKTMSAAVVGTDVQPVDFEYECEVYLSDAQPCTAPPTTAHPDDQDDECEVYLSNVEMCNAPQAPALLATAEVLAQLDEDQDIPVVHFDDDDEDEDESSNMQSLPGSPVPLVRIDEYPSPPYAQPTVLYDPVADTEHVSAPTTDAVLYDPVADTEHTVATTSNCNTVPMDISEDADAVEHAEVESYAAQPSAAEKLADSLLSSMLDDAINAIINGKPQTGTAPSSPRTERNDCQPAAPLQPTPARPVIKKIEAHSKPMPVELNFVPRYVDPIQSMPLRPIAPTGLSLVTVRPMSKPQVTRVQCGLPSTCDAVQSDPMYFFNKFKRASGNAVYYESNYGFV